MKNSMTEVAFNVVILVFGVALAIQASIEWNQMREPRTNIAPRSVHVITGPAFISIEASGPITLYEIGQAVMDGRAKIIYEKE